jgi:transcriptional regulator with XRE-family HTH domain
LPVAPGRERLEGTVSMGSSEPEGNRAKQPISLGDIIRQQRELAALPLRQLAAMAGISNPYLSQIERGIRAPSEQVLDAIATSLRTSADALHEQAARMATARPPTPAVIAAIETDPDLTVRQRQALVEIYSALTETTIARRRRHRADTGKPGTDDGPGLAEDDDD